MSPIPRLTLRDLRLRGVQVPLRTPLVTGGGTLSSVPLLLLDLLTEEGITGSTYLFCYTPPALRPTLQLLREMLPLLRGTDASPQAIESLLGGRFRLLGTPGIVGMALAGLDMAAWDALARAAGLPLVRLLGGRVRGVRAYNSNGLGLGGPQRVAEEARALLQAGLPAVKLRLGYPTLAADLDAVRAVREVIGERTLMVDYNQSLSPAEARLRAAALAGEGLAWVEEPTRADDDAGHAAIRAVGGAPVQIGENWWGPAAMARSLAAGACDLAMPDAMKIGGVSGWLRAAALADAAGMPLSSHLFPEVSVHLLAASPTAHWLEYVDWAEPVLQSAVRRDGDGHAWPGEAPGSGIEWDEAAVARYEVA